MNYKTGYLQMCSQITELIELLKKMEPEKEQEAEQERVNISQCLRGVLAHGKNACQEGDAAKISGIPCASLFCAYRSQKDSCMHTEKGIDDNGFCAYYQPVDIPFEEMEQHRLTERQYVTALEEEAAREQEKNPME